MHITTCHNKLNKELQHCVCRYVYHGTALSVYGWLSLHSLVGCNKASLVTGYWLITLTIIWIYKSSIIIFMAVSVYTAGSKKTHLSFVEAFGVFIQWNLLYGWHFFRTIKSGFCMIEHSSSQRKPSYAMTFWYIRSVGALIHVHQTRIIKLKSHFLSHLDHPSSLQCTS